MNVSKFFVKALKFVSELNNAFSDKYPNIQLYYKLLKKTSTTNQKAIEKHVEFFRVYLEANEEAIKTKNSKLFVLPSIIFNDKIFINLSDCFFIADRDTKDIMFSHLQVLLYILKPSDEMKTLVQQEQKEEEKPGEMKFIDNLVEKIGKQFNETEVTDPMQAAMSMMKSGLFTDIIQSMSEGVQDGSLNPQALLGSVQGMLGNLTGGSVDINNVLNGNMDKLEIKGEDGKDVNIDMNQVFNMVGSMVGSLNETGILGDTNNGGNDIMSGLMPVISGLTSGNTMPNIDELEEQMKNMDFSKELD